MPGPVNAVDALAFPGTAISGAPSAEDIKILQGKTHGIERRVASGTGLGIRMQGHQLTDRLGTTDIRLHRGHTGRRRRRGLAEQALHHQVRRISLGLEGVHLDDMRIRQPGEGASDVHFEPKEDGLVVRFRLDGEMHGHLRLPVAQREALLARGKIFGGMDITEKRLPQDGRAVLREKGRRFHLRLSTLPTVHGESLVIRLLDQTMPSQDFSQLGLAPPQAEALRASLAGPAGLVYLTGPTGSGKTTTLHAALHSLDHEGRVIHTLEDPVEYEFVGIRQTEIREKIGLTFATSLRALLRQNPDILLVGETRDAETAQLAIRAALTGHLVLSTLHTNDALAAIPRLRDLGVESFLLAASLRLVAAQRLVRRLCAECKAPHPENADRKSVV